MALGLTGFTQLMSGQTDDEKIWGKKPEYGPLKSYIDVLTEYVSGNRKILPELQSLGLEATGGYSKMMEKAYPGITELKNLGTRTAKSFLSGELPQVVQDQLKTQAAEYGVGSGTGTSGFAGARGLRNLGIESLRYTQAGLDSASRWINQAQGQTFDFSKMFPSVGQAFDWTIQQKNQEKLIADVAAAPEPAARGAFDTEMQWIGMILSAYSGGGGYKPQPYQGWGGGGGGWGSPNAMGGTGGSYFGGGTTAGDFYGDYMNARGAGMLGG